MSVSLAKATVSVSTDEPIMAHWHAGQPSKGCVAACGRAFQGENAPRSMNKPCPACLEAQMLGTVVMCECSK